jgi:DNA-binding transcriptional regulator YiaG
MNDITFNTLQDFSKKEISTIEKGLFIKKILNEEKISMRELARRLNIPHSTLQDWCSNRQMTKYYKAKDNELHKLADRLLFLLSKEEKIDDKSLAKLRLLKSQLFKMYDI